MLPTDSGSLLWWSMSGEKVKEVKIGSPDFLVRLDWSVSRQSLWVCGFSALRLLSVSRDEQGGTAVVWLFRLYNTTSSSLVAEAVEDTTKKFFLVVAWLFRLLTTPLAVVWLFRLLLRAHVYECLINQCNKLLRGRG